MRIIHISLAGPTRTIIDANGKRWTFEMHHYCGPIMLNKRGDPMERQPGERSPFWHAVTRWAQGGHRLNGIEWHIAGKHYRVVGSE